jgi:very-short-patch-repair endonuclease
MGGMRKTDALLHEIARRRWSLLTRPDVLSVGGNDQLITRRLAAGRWQRLHDGVHLVGLGPPTWLQRTLAACLAGGPTAVTSHRAAALLWELDGARGSIVEVTVSMATRAHVRRAVVHRSRRLDEADVTSHRGVPVTTVERTLADLGRYLPPLLIEMALESALRRRLTSEQRLWTFLDSPGAYRRPGVGRLRRVVSSRSPGRAAGSPAEVALVGCLRARGLPQPVRQHPITLRDGTVAVVDLAWPAARLAVEWDGFDVHSGRRAFSADLQRQNALLDVGYQLRRFTGDAVRRHADQVAAVVARALHDQLARTRTAA